MEDIDLNLDEAESAFLKAVLSGSEGSPGPAALAPEGVVELRRAAAIPDRQDAAANVQTGDAAPVPQRRGVLLSALGPVPSTQAGEPTRTNTYVSAQQVQHPQQERLLRAQVLTPGRAGAADTSDSLVRPKEQQPSQQPLARPNVSRSPPLPKQQQQQRNSLLQQSWNPAAGSQDHLGPEVPWYAEPAGQPSALIRPPAAASSRPGASQPRSPAAQSLSSSPAPTTTATLPSSQSDGLVSEANLATPTTTITSTQHPYRAIRRRGSNLRVDRNSPGTGGNRCTSPASISRRTFQITLLSAAAATTAAVSAAATTAAAAAPSPASSRRAQGLLQRIKSLEAQLTELLLTKDVGAGTQAGAAEAAMAVAEQQQRRLAMVVSVAEQLCRDYNSSGVALMEAGLDEAAREQLAKALLLAGLGGPLECCPEKQREMQIVAHNNLACYHRKFRQPALALEHLKHAARLETAAAAAKPSSVALEPENETSSADAEAPASAATGAAAAADGGSGSGQGPTAATLLNLAAVSSSLGQHTQALSYAARAVNAAAAELLVPLGPLEAALLRGLPQAQLWGLLPQLRRACQGATTQLAMAYYNRAVEQEHLQQWQCALESYRMAVDVAGRFVGRGDDLTLTMQQSAEAFKVRLRKLEKRGKVRTARGASTAATAALGGLNGWGSCPGSLSQLPPPPSPPDGGSAAPGNTGGTNGGGSCCGAVLPRPRPHLRPLLRCATAVTTTATTTIINTAAAAAAAACAGLAAKGIRSPSSACLPSIPGRRASAPASAAGLAPSPGASSSTAGGGGPHAAGDAPVGRCPSSLDALAAAPAALVPRRAFSAGRAGTPQTAAASAAAVMASPAWPHARRAAAESSTASRSSACHMAARAQASVSPRRNGSSGCVLATASSAAGCTPELRPLGGCTSGLVASPPRTPAPSCSLGACSERKQQSTSGDGSLAAAAAAAVAAAAELARIYAAGEDVQAAAHEYGRGLGQAGWGALASGDGGSNSCWRTGQGTPPPPPVFSSPSKMTKFLSAPSHLAPVGAGGGLLHGAGDACSRGGGSPARRSPPGVCPGGMLVPKRDGVAV